MRSTACAGGFRDVPRRVIAAVNGSQWAAVTSCMFSVTTCRSPRTRRRRCCSFKHSFNRDVEHIAGISNIAFDRLDMPVDSEEGAGAFAERRPPGFLVITRIEYGGRRADRAGVSLGGATTAGNPRHLPGEGGGGEPAPISRRDLVKRPTAGVGSELGQDGRDHQEAGDEHQGAEHR